VLKLAARCERERSASEGRWPDCNIKALRCLVVLAKWGVTLARVAAITVRMRDGVPAGYHFHV